MEWDEEKRRANIEKHGVDFERFAEFDWDGAVFMETQVVDGEQREVVLGRIGLTVHVAVYTERDAMRLISLRPANRQERRRWDHGE